MGELHIREERMADFFVKYHVEGLPVATVFHRFTEADRGDPHDHPWPFSSFILYGGYLEEVFDLETRTSRIVERPVGASFRNQAGHVHRIIRLLAEECWTLILPEAWERKSGFYQVREHGLFHRFWDQPEFAPLSAAPADEREVEHV